MIIHRRARIILLSAERRTAKEIAEMVGLTCATVRSVIVGFNRFGIGCVYPKKKSGRPRKFGQHTQDRIIELLRHKPTEFGIQSGVWTLEDARTIARDEGIVESIGVESIRRILKQASLSWKRVKGWIKPSDPRYEEKKARRDRIVKRALCDPESDIEHTDESWFVAQKPEGALNPQTGHSWSPVGNPERIRTSNKKGRETLAVFAGLSVKDGSVHHRFSEKVNTEETIQYLSWRAEESRERGIRRLYIIWDNGSWHLSKGLRGWLRQHNGKARRDQGTIISVATLPKRSPWLNPIESVFGWLKRKVLLCRVHDDLQNLKGAIAACIAYRNERKKPCVAKSYAYF